MKEKKTIDISRGRQEKKLCKRRRGLIIGKRNMIRKIR
jgi:hypothetical protein